jgi:hypothetical protein
MRSVWFVLLLAFGAGAASDAWAASKEELAADKERYKDAKSRWKDVSKLSEKWAKAHEKGDDEKKKELDDELVVYYREDISMIREAGVEVRPAEDEPAPPGTVSGGGNKPDLEPARLEALRDTIVPLKDGETKGDDKVAALAKYADILEERYERRLSQYETAKAES